MHPSSLRNYFKILAQKLQHFAAKSLKMNMRLFLLTALLLLPLSTAKQAAGAGLKNLTADESALLSFKAHVTDSYGVLAKNWSVSYPLCSSWVGVTCGARRQRVTALNVSGMGLAGTVPPHLKNLSFLASLDVSQNSFHGRLPSELEQLRRLTYLSVSYNRLSGSFPPWIGALSKLQTLDLQNNSFTGSIPESLCNLSRMEQLGVRSNAIGGNIPAKIGNLTKLTSLDFGYNEIQGEIPKEIGNLGNLENLILGGNKLNGPLPPLIFNISNLRRFILFSNQISGHLPSTIGYSLPSLEFLTMADNHLSGTIPSSITNASNLIGLDLSSNSFSGHIPNTFGNLRHLRVFSVYNNTLTTTDQWSFLSSLTNCRDLTVLAVGSNPLAGFLPPSIGNFSASLQRLFVNNCKLQGSIPPEIGNLSGLIVLSLYENGLNGTIPKTVRRLEQLQGIDLHYNNLQGSIPDDICGLERLQGLYLYENQLSGHLPPCFGSLVSLRDLLLYSNKLSSNIPSSFWSLEYILSINLSSNSLTGSLPSSIQNLKVLVDLDLSKNQLSGDLPPTIGGLKNLATLSLAGNRFGGPLPPSLGGLTSLETLDLSNNNFSGLIPKSLEKLLYLRSLDASHNRLEGEIPSNGSFRNFSAESFSWNYGLCGRLSLQVPPCKKENHKGSKKGASFFLKYILPPVIAVILIATAIIMFLKRRRAKSAKSVDEEDLQSLATWKRISYLELQRATDGFNDCNLLGEGSFGTVYKGTLSQGTNIAVKVFNLQSEKGFKSFESECEVLRNVRHRNLIKILSSCCNPEFKALVLEFMPSGSLEKWLYAHNHFLDFQQRLDIMIDVGLALQYLHHGHSSAPVVHCDLKPSNILLDENLVAHVSDFGISKLLGEGDDNVTQTMTLATIGYMAPEYGSEGVVSVRCDIYSYGILLMETFTRKKPTDEMFTGTMSLKNWVNDSLPQGLTQVVDANLVREQQFFSAKMDALLSIIHVALNCCMDSPDQRISMADATVEIKKIQKKFVSDVAGKKN